MLNQPTTREQEKRLAQLRNREWLDENIDKIQKDYADQWIGILDSKIVSNSQDVKIVQKAVEGREDEAVVMRIPKDTIPTPI
ncbi:hypothetical protein ES708_06441 [subsurface metagenome]